jgi:hypothetical protein
MGSFLNNLAYQWRRAKRAHADSVENANSWAWLSGYAAVWGILGAFGYSMMEPNGPGGVILLA